MNFKEFYSARDLITKIVSQDLLGPVEENEILTESPVSYYLVGKIYPRNIANIENEEVKLEEENLFCDEELIALGNGGYPSAMGFTFSLEKTTSSFKIRAKAAYYEFNEDNKTWKRKTIEINPIINIRDLSKKRYIRENIKDNLFLHVSFYKNISLENFKLTVTIVNNSISQDLSYRELSKLTYFQPELEIFDPVDGNFCELINKNPSIGDDETKELELLYHNMKSYAIGHGCATNWEKDINGIPKRIYLTIIPEHAVLQMKPSSCISGKFLSMKFLSEATYEDIAKGINSLCTNYKNWIEELQTKLPTIEKSLKDTAKSNLLKCKTTLKRLSDSIKILKDKTVFKAFQYANKAMFLQRKTVLKEINDDSITWYPFQLAFLLIEIEPIVFPQSRNRKTVDLLWFPTGGGKTEAYLGISAFTIFYRRMREMNNGSSDSGVAVFMRYTLRLLSFQQFERASSMICAAEFIRKKEKLGDTPFGIGLWAGKSLTPNELKDAESYLKGLTSENTNPVQVKKCPWCSLRLDIQDYNVDKNKKRMNICCPNEKCEFHDGLPIHLVDEDIYAHKPSFIIGTVDKFARIAFKNEAGELFGVDSHNPPELIIQDELHLISGPLGTITGIYEAAITKLCEKNGVKPKIIASTATIRNAENQIKSLYGMDYEQFPPQGFSIDDSYFAQLSNRDEKAERNYIGIFSSGSSRAVSFIRITGALLFASRYLIDAGYSEEVIDAFWTQTGYFNTLRELGSALVRIVDSVQDRFDYLKETKFKDKYAFKSNHNRYDKIYEMTSRETSIDLGNAIQNELTIPYSKNSDTNPYDFLIASNMISVGVDVPRLNNMLVVGQPLKSSEYIQSTSRVGRKTPGLVYIIYHPTTSRDRSHYEQFTQYHQSLYKYVEATSLTPFADRARDRALQALYVILCRYLVPKLRKNEDAVNFKKNIPELEDVRNYIYNYVKVVDESELENVKKEIFEIESEWEDRASHATKLLYYNYSSNDDSLFKEDYNERSRFRMMNSMRSVEPTVQVTTYE